VSEEDEAGRQAQSGASEKNGSRRLGRMSLEYGFVAD